MISSKEELLNTISRIKGLPVLVVGDIILDRYIWGAVDRISPEAAVPVVEVKQIEDRLGGAANVVRNLTSLGARVSLCGLIGDDEEGKIVLDLLAKDGVEKDGVIIDRGRPTCLKTRVMAQKQQVVRIDRESSVVQGVALQEGFAAVVDAHLNASKVVVLSDYGKGALSEPLIRKLSQAKDDKRIGLGTRPMVVDPHPANYDLYRGITVAKPNRREAEMASGVRITSTETAFEAARILLQKWGADMMLITLGEDGLVICTTSNDKDISLATVALQVFDVSGAGDTVTAIFSAAIAAGASPAVAGDLANIGAGVVVSEVGTVPINVAKLKREIDRLALIKKNT